MAPFRPWADLPPELLIVITHGFDLPLGSYCRARAVCSAWRAALPPPVPSLISIVIPEAPVVRRKQVSALTLPEGRAIPLATICLDSQCVGSCNGWIAVRSPSEVIFLMDPLGGKKVQLLPLQYEAVTPVSKIVFAPNPTPTDYVAVAVFGQRRLAYIRAPNKRWMIIDVAMDESDRLVDLAYDAGGGMVYCVTKHGDVRVLHIPSDRPRRKPIVEPLQAERAGGLPFDPTAVFGPPWDTASKYTDFKWIFFIGGDLYQLWWNTTSTLFWTMPGGRRFHMPKGEIFVLKYDPERRPCWNRVKDLGGYSVFIGKNNPEVMKADDAPGVRANCVYWIDEWPSDKPMVFDMATGTSTLYPAATSVLSSARIGCWQSA
ncbi:hypothetical protein EJB05_39165, partial [Eragrostis curvula]